MSEGFTKLFSSITDSTIWAEDSDTRVVWVTMLAMAERDGFVPASIPGIANRARVSIATAEAAIAKFMAPDPYSRSKEHDGRRVEEAERGFQLLNYAKFRDMRDQENRRETNRKAQKEHRAREKARKEAEFASANVSASKADSKQSQPLSAHAESDAESDAEAERERARASDPAESFEKVELPTELANSQADRRRALDLAEAERLELRKLVRLEFSGRFHLAEGSMWTQAGDPAVDTLVSWLLSVKVDRKSSLEKMLNTFFADVWCRSKHYPIAHLAKYPQKYLDPREAPSTGTRTVERELSKPAQEAQALSDKLRANGKFF
jgi:hypothetical protein